MALVGVIFTRMFCLVQCIQFHERIAGGVIHSTQNSDVIARNKGNVDRRFGRIGRGITGGLNRRRLRVGPVIVSHHSVAVGIPKIAPD
jgi:hypothetical protein